MIHIAKLSNTFTNQPAEGAGFLQTRTSSKESSQLLLRVYYFTANSIVTRHERAALNSMCSALGTARCNAD